MDSYHTFGALWYIIPGQNLFYIGRKPPRRTRLEAFKITPTWWCGWKRMSAAQATPWSYKFRIRKSLLVLPLGHFRFIQWRKTVGVNPMWKNSSLLVLTGPRTPISRLYDVIASRTHDSIHTWFTWPYTGYVTGSYFWGLQTWATSVKL